MAEAAAAAGRHVIIEKPIATTLADARAIVDIPRRYGVQVFVAENMRYHGFLDPTIALVAGGAIGELFLVTWRYMSGLGPDNPYANTTWRQIPEHPGGFFSDVNVHTANGLRALAGEISRVHCLARQVRPWLGGLDTAVFNLEFQIRRHWYADLQPGRGHRAVDAADPLRYNRHHRGLLGGRRVTPARARSRGLPT